MPRAGAIQKGYAPLNASSEGVPRGGAAALGVDTGCGMMAMRTTLTASDLPDSLARLRSGIEAAVPHGGIGLKGGWKDGVPNAVGRLFADSGLADGLKELEEKHPAVRG